MKRKLNIQHLFPVVHTDCSGVTIEITMGNTALRKRAKETQKKQRQAAEKLRKLSTEMKRYEDSDYFATMARGFQGIDLAQILAIGKGFSQTLVAIGSGALLTASLVSSFLKSRKIDPYIKDVQTILTQLEGDLKKLVEQLKKQLDESDVAQIERSLRNKTEITISSQRRNVTGAIAVVNDTIKVFNLFVKQSESYNLLAIVQWGFSCLMSLCFGTNVEETGSVFDIRTILDRCLKGTLNVTKVADLLDEMAGILE